MNADTEKRNKNAERHTANQCMAKHLTGIYKIISSDKMSHLYRKACSRRTKQATYKPGS